jgi:hypothetical protein
MVKPWLRTAFQTPSNHPKVFESERFKRRFKRLQTVFKRYSNAFKGTCPHTPPYPPRTFEAPAGV